ncbi:DUF1926 domain-containing protein [candidate division KSB1 bacterium]|nr:DUF1926 domain-containing protein [candidate division KSB1 bacterium]
MFKKINFIFGVHCHQPVGNFDHVFEEAYQKSYLPFLGVLEQFPQIRVVLHYSGSLLEWIEDRHPDFLNRVKEIIHRGQAELLTGGFYEPILPIIPDEDKIGQITSYTELLTKRFACHPQGLWLTERVWEPHLAKPLAQAGVRYIAVDDYHFKSTGMGEGELGRYFMTDELGKTLAIFPISERLRYLIPFEKPGDTIEYLRSWADPSGERLLVLADDGEKFGLWPGTYDWVYGQKWLESFFRDLGENADWISVTTFSDFMEKHPPAGRVYLPTASYFEMSQWTLPAQSGEKFEALVEDLKEKGRIEEYKPYLKGGFWRNFLAKYPESNNMHKRMLRVSGMIHHYEKEKGVLLREERRELYRGQTNCGYWHGVFGGLYLPHLRDAVYRHLLKAERLLEARIHSGKDWIEVERTDFDRDGSDEIIVNTKSLSLFFSPGDGGHLFELDYKPTDFNLINTLARRPESYHRGIREYHPGQQEGERETSIHDLTRPVDEDLKRFLVYDRARRVSLIDHFLGPTTDLDGFRLERYREAGDFIKGRYQAAVRESRGRVRVQMSREGRVVADGREGKLSVTKTIQILTGRDVITIDYALRNLAAEGVKLWFGSEFNFSMLGSKNKGVRYVIPGEDLKANGLGDKGELVGVRTFQIVDDRQGIEISLDFLAPVTLWYFPIETISQSESGYDKLYQSSVVFPNWKIDLKPKGAWKVRFFLRIDSI